MRRRQPPSWLIGGDRNVRRGKTLLRREGFAGDRAVNRAGFRFQPFRNQEAMFNQSIMHLTFMACFVGKNLNCNFTEL